MNKVIFCISLTFIFSTHLVFAAGKPLHSLGGDMKGIAATLKKISANVNNTSSNQESAADAETLIELFSDAQKRLPFKIAVILLPSQRDAAREDYENLIQQEIDYSAALETAFLNNENDTAAAIIKQMWAIQEEGHAKYKFP